MTPGEVCPDVGKDFVQWWLNFLVNGSSVLCVFYL